MTSENSIDNISKMNIKRLYVDFTTVKDYFCAMVDTNCDNSQQQCLNIEDDTNCDNSQ